MPGMRTGRSAPLRRSRPTRERACSHPTPNFEKNGEARREWRLAVLVRPVLVTGLSYRGPIPGWCGACVGWADLNNVGERHDRRHQMDLARVAWLHASARG